MIKCNNFTCEPTIFLSSSSIFKMLFHDTTYLFSELSESTYLIVLSVPFLVSPVLKCQNYNLSSSHLTLQSGSYLLDWNWIQCFLWFLREKMPTEYLSVYNCHFSCLCLSSTFKIINSCRNSFRYVHCLVQQFEYSWCSIFYID